jgi:hypothetical protein
VRDTNYAFVMVGLALRDTVAVLSWSSVWSESWRKDDWGLGLGSATAIRNEVEAWRRRET